MRISFTKGNLINRSDKSLSFCMVGLALFLFCVSTPTKAEEAFDSPLAKITDQIATAVNNANLKAVTVPGFTDLHDNESDLGLFLADQVSAGLVQRKCAVVDRSNVAKILAEHKLTASGLVDPENAKKLGQFAGVDAIVIGTTIPLSGTIRVTVRVLATDSARVLAATSADIPKTNSIRHLIGEPEIPEPTPTIRQALPRRSEGSSATPQPDQPVQEEEVPPIAYIGHVGQLDAIFSLKWLPGGKIQGTYFYPKRGINRSYTLLGENSEDGKIYLEEYTDKALTARMELVKSITAGEIVWEGVMQNVDGRRFEMSLRRDR
jgi:FlgO protein